MIPAAQVERLARDVQAALLAKRAVLAQSDGNIAIRITKAGSGWEIKITPTLD